MSTTPEVAPDQGIRISTVAGGRVEARAQSPDRSVPAGGRLLGVARRVHGGEQWIIRAQGDPVPVFADDEQAARARLAEMVEGVR